MIILSLVEIGVIYLAAVTLQTLSAGIECKCGGNFAYSNATTVRNHTLRWHISRTIVVHDVMDCFTKCVEEDCVCVSFNFQRESTDKDSHICELNIQDKKLKTNALKPRTGWDYHDIIYEVGNRKN